MLELKIVLYHVKSEYILLVSSYYEHGMSKMSSLGLYT